jgi:hypothetical protein
VLGPNFANVTPGPQLCLVQIESDLNPAAGTRKPLPWVTKSRHLAVLRQLSDRDASSNTPPSSRPAQISQETATPRGAVALCKAGAGEIVGPGWSDRQGQLVEGSQDLSVCYFLDSEFVVAAADVLHERVSGADHPCAAETCEAAHRP